MSNVATRMLSAGTVNPDTSPRARAMYSSWMLDERAPSAWLASHTIQRTASAVGSSVVNAAVHARSAAAWDPERGPSATAGRPPSAGGVPDSWARRSAGHVATWGIVRGLL